MATIHHQPDVVRGYRPSNSPAPTSQRPERPVPQRPSTPPTAWRQRIPGPQLPGFVTGVTLLVGIWLLLAPAVWGYGDTGGGFDARWNDLVVGLLVTVVAIARLARRIRLGAATILGMAAGLWLISAPLVLAYGLGAHSTPATANDMLTGLLLTVVTIIGHASARMSIAARI